MNRKSVVYSIPDEEFINIVKNSKTYREIFKYFNVVGNRSCGYNTLKKRIKELNIDFVSQGNIGSSRVYNKISIDCLLKENREIFSTSRFKERLIKENYLKNVCSICGLNSWQGKSLSLQLHHKNGISTDNRIENLEILCPNCHSQTDTYTGKNIKKKIKIIKKCECGNILSKKNESGFCRICFNKKIRKRICKISWPSKEELENMIKIEPLTTLAKKLKVSNTTIKKHAKKIGIDLSISPWVKFGRRGGI